MKLIFGFLLMILGIILGVYVGVYLMLFQGIIQVIEAIKAIPIGSFELAVGIIRIIFSAFLGWLSFCILFIPGYVMIFNNRYKF